MTVLVAKGSSETTIERYMENYKNVLQDIRNQLDAKVEAVRIILTGIDNDIYSIVDACSNMKFTSQDGESLESYYSRFVTLVKQSQELKTVSYHKLYDILKQHQNEVNKIRVERLAHTTYPLALVSQQQTVYHPQNHPNHYTQNSSTILQQATTRNRGKVIVNSPPPIYDQEPNMVTEDDALSKEKEIDKLMVLISLSFKKIYKPTNNNLITSSNTTRSNQDNTPRIKPLQKVQKNNDNYNVFANDKEHLEQPESINDTYLEEQDDTNITIDSLDMSTNGETVDQDDDDLAKERDLLASLTEKLKCEIDDSKNHNKFLESSNKTLIEKLKEMKKELVAYQETIFIMSQEKEAQNKFYKTHEDKEIEKVIALENKVKVLDDIVYKTGQSVQTLNMLNRNYKMGFVKAEFLKKAQRSNPRLYDIGCYNYNLALMLPRESDEMIRLAQESRSKL
nr:hypothetical protein [Tanacetum cinerariifolium]